jgi:uncharacterized protein YutE (UPF0331/DUF86 family)/predicted nucleotidyltransferase
MGKVDAVIAFGSKARGDDRVGSDLDVLVFAHIGDDIVSIMPEVEGLFPGAPLDIRLFSQSLSPALAYDILKDARILYEADLRLGVLSLAELALLAEPTPPPFEIVLEVKKVGPEETLRKIERRLVSLERKKAGLAARMIGVSQQSFLADEMLQEFAFARLYKLTQDVIDLAALMIALEGRVPPAEASERLVVLGEMGLISSALSSRLVRMARFRNVLARVYEELDLIRLYRFAGEEVQDLDAFNQALKAYLEQKLAADERTGHNAGSHQPLARMTHHSANRNTNALDRCFAWRYSGPYTMEDDARWQSQNCT